MKTSKYLPAAKNSNNKFFAIISFTVLFCVPLIIFAQSPVWQQLPDMSKSKAGLTASVVDDMIYAIGGGSGTGVFYDEVEVYSPEFNVWMNKTNMPTPRWMHAAAVLDGKIYVIGGGWPGSVLNTVEMYDPAYDIWETMAPMPTPRAFLGAAVVDGIIYAIGGGMNMEEHYAIVEAYDPLKNMWETKQSMQFARAGLGVCVFDNKIYAIGGGTGDALKVVERYDPKTDEWERLADLPTPRFAVFACDVDVCLDGEKIYVFGGTSGIDVPAVSTVEAYYPALNSWQTKIDMPIGRMWMGGCLMQDKVFILGGEEECKVVNPHAQTFSSVYSFNCNALTAVEEPFDKPGFLIKVYPNPVIDKFFIEYTLSEPYFVNIDLVDLVGNKLKPLVNCIQGSGAHKLQIDGTDLVQGIYVLDMFVNGDHQLQKFVVTH